MSQHEQLPLHPVPDAERDAATTARLSIAGLVANPRTLTVADLAALPRRTLTMPFTCEEGWTVPGLEWRGIPLMDVLALSQPAAEGRFIQVSAGAYSISLTLDESGESLLCDTLNGQPLTVGHGAPWRLIVPGGKCFTSVKWVQRLIISREPGDNSGEQLARARLT